VTDRLLEVGRIGRTHGVRGQLYVDLLTDREERVAAGARLLAGERWLTVASARRAGSRWLVQFVGCDDRNAAELLVNAPLLAEPLPDPVDGLYVHQLIGGEVVGPEGDSFGRCVAIVANPAHDLLELDDGSLVPTVFITARFDGRIVIDPPPGLFDLGE
jgi:16S rRNA processing protein RimM